MDYMLEHHARHGMYTSEHVEILISPAGSTTSFYQFFVRYGGEKICYFYEEGGNIKPDPYAPDWKTATYTGEDFWSAEVEMQRDISLSHWAARGTEDPLWTSVLPD